MKVIIPVAGSGTRLRPHTFTKPKPLLTVAGKPILGHIIGPLVSLSPSEVIFVTGHMGDQIEDWVRKTYQFPARFVHQDRLLGLGYALHLALSTVQNEPVLIVLGDTITDCDLKRFVKAGTQVLGLKQVNDPKRFGIAELENGYVGALEEKPERPNSNLAIVGLYYFEDCGKLKTCLAELVKAGKQTRGEIQLTDALQQLIEMGEKITPFEVNGWHDCGKVETLLETNRNLLAGMKTSGVTSDVRESALIPPVYIAASARVFRSVVGPNVSVDGGSVIQHSILENCVVYDNARLDHVFAKDSIIGSGAQLRGSQGVFNLSEDSIVTVSKQ